MKTATTPPKHVIKTIVCEATDIKNGAYAKYVKINDQIGFKFYRSSTQRNNEYDNQMELFELGCGPELFEKFEFDFKDNQIYGFVVEHIPYLAADFVAREFLFEYPEYRTADGGVPGYKDLNIYHGDELQFFHSLEEKYSDIIESFMEDNGCHIGDMHVLNWGFRADASIAIIDAGGG